MSEKIIQITQLGSFPEHLKNSDQVLVFTNGCFDILHPGHVHYLSEARKLGDILIVGLNSDASVRRLKGTNRPINNFEYRSKMLAALESVSYVIGFSEDTPIDLIKNIGPDILVKGGDYNLDQIAGKDYVEKRGGKVLTIALLKGHSTSDFIQKNKKSLIMAISIHEVQEYLHSIAPNHLQEAYDNSGLFDR